MLNEFVEKILVHERDRKGSQDTTQEIEIYFNFVGKYVTPQFREVTLLPRRNRKNCAKKKNVRTGFIETICGARPVASRKGMRNG